MFKFMLGLALAAALLSLAACATLKGSHAPDVNLKSDKTYYVVHRAEDNGGVDKLIAARLTAMGYTASSGDSPTPPAPVDVVVTYEDHWMWDMTMYMIRLSIQFHDGKTGAVIASAESYRPSLERKSPEAMVQEVLTKIYE
jgi:hypothetical protein